MSEQFMDAINSGDESDHDLISTKMLEDICDGSQTHINVNRRETGYKIRDRIRQRQPEWKSQRLARLPLLKLCERIYIASLFLRRYRIPCIRHFRMHRHCFRIRS